MIDPHPIGTPVLLSMRYAGGTTMGTIEQYRRNSAGRIQYLVRWDNRAAAPVTWTWHSDVLVMRVTVAPSIDTSTPEGRLALKQCTAEWRSIGAGR